MDAHPTSRRAPPARMLLVRSSRPRVQVPERGTLTLEYTALLSSKRQDRGVFFSQPMDERKFGRLRTQMHAEALSDFERWTLVKMAAAVNYFTSKQVKMPRAARARAQPAQAFANRRARRARRASDPGSPSRPRCWSR
jgi:hypothetical protein